MLSHVEIYVSDLEKSRRFWQWLLCEELGYEIYQDWPEGVSFREGGTYIVFVQTPKKHLSTGYNRCRTGLNHLAFHARTKSHVDDLTAKLRARGVTILYEDRHPHAGGPETYAVFFEDPDRIKVEVVLALAEEL
ncbi:MAG: VOC family protein [Calditrichaeota bacterium]|nr:VOC family protein [Calditrichota bacterium]MCB9369275.1 VOC family protein [Calditrichota bacterium]